MQAGGARGAVGEAGGRLRSHPASSGMLSPGRCTLVTSRVLEDRAGTRRLLQGADLALRSPTPGRAGPPALGFPLRTARRLLAGSRGRPGGGAGQSRARIPGSLARGGRETPCLLPSSSASGGVGGRPGFLQSRLPLLPGSGGVLCSLYRPGSCCHSGSQKRPSG